MNALKVWLSARGWFPTIRVCAKCKRITGARWGTAQFPTKAWIEKTHGICDTCGPRLYGKFWGGL